MRDAYKRLQWFAVLLFAVSPSVWAAGSPLQNAKAAYDDLQYERCAEVLAPLNRERIPKAERAQIELYDGLCRFALARTDEAKGHFQLALRLDPLVQLPPLASPKLVAFFRSIAGRGPKPEPAAPLASTPAAPAETPPPSDAPVAQAEPPPVHTLAPVEAPVVAARPDLSQAAPAPEHHRSWILPVVLGSAAVAVAGGAVAFGVAAHSAEQDSLKAVYWSDVNNAATASHRDATIANVGVGLASALAVGAILAVVLDR